jgi:hypothetical protein
MKSCGIEPALELGCPRGYVTKCHTDEGLTETVRVRHLYACIISLLCQQLPERDTSYFRPPSKSTIPYIITLTHNILLPVVKGCWNDHNRPNVFTSTHKNRSLCRLCRCLTSFADRLLTCGF